MTATTLTQHQARAHALAEKLIEFLQTSEVPDGLFAAGMFCDFTMPAWRLQASGVEDSVALRLAGHPGQGTVLRWRFDPTPTGFVLEVEEAWDGAASTGPVASCSAPTSATRASPSSRSTAPVTGMRRGGRSTPPR